MARKRRKRSVPRHLPIMMAELTLASWETFARRWLMVLNGTCSGAEYRRMVVEKMRAARRSNASVLGRKAPSAILAPWHGPAVANARRLRKRARLL
jgi:hypothetical protein